MRSRSNAIYVILVIFSLMLVIQYTAFAQSKSQGKGKASRLERYMIIARNNLFKPLGSGGEVKRQEFALNGILGSVALIQAVDEPKSYYVTEGGSFANGAKLARIGEDSVTIVHEGNKIELRLGSGVPDGREGSKGFGPPGKPANSRER